MFAAFILIVLGAEANFVLANECYMPMLCGSRTTTPMWVKVPQSQADQDKCVHELADLVERVNVLSSGIASLSEHLHPSPSPTSDAQEAMTTAIGVTSVSPVISTVSPTSGEVSATVEDATANSTQVRLVGGGAPNKGRVEIYHNGDWGTVCDDYWGLADADVICRMLGYMLATDAPYRAHFDHGSGRIWIDDVKCFGNESDISACVHGGWGRHNCGHSEDASVVCSHETAAEIWHVSASNVPDWTVRLVNGSTSNEGRVEVSRHGVWGTICGVNWDAHDGNVTCRMMGYSWASNTWRDAHFGQGDGPVWLRYLYCGGSEGHISDCNGYHTTCNHENDASVRCT